MVHGTGNRLVSTSDYANDCASTDEPELVALHNRLRKLGDLADEASERLANFRDRARGGQPAGDSVPGPTPVRSDVIGSLNDQADIISTRLDRIFQTTAQIERIA
jgi:hypothetical protein